MEGDTWLTFPPILRAFAVRVRGNLRVPQYSKHLVRELLTCLRPIAPRNPKVTGS